MKRTKLRVEITRMNSGMQVERYEKTIIDKNIIVFRLLQSLGMIIFE